MTGSVQLDPDIVIVEILGLAYRFHLLVGSHWNHAYFGLCICKRNFHIDKLL